MKINDIFATFKVAPRTGWLLIALVGVAIAALLFFSIGGTKKPLPVVAVLNTAQAQMETQFKNQLKEKDVQIKDYKSRLAVSDAKYKTLVQKYNDLQKEKENVKAPTSNTETRNRFIALDFVPLPAK